MEPLMDQTKPKRILIVDDNQEIHKDFYKILSQNSDFSAVDEAEALLFGEKISQEHDKPLEYKIDSAYQGEAALELVREALLNGEPYALAFIDMRMPPGWDGIETIQHIWAVDPLIQIVICSAHSDHSWEETTQTLGDSDSLLILKKPFEMIEISQLAFALTRKWELMANLHALIKIRTSSLENLYSRAQATLESVREGILAVGLDGSIQSYNNNFLKQWGISESFLKSKRSDVVFEKLSELVENPVFFLKVMNESKTKCDASNIKEWQLTTGSILELSMCSQYYRDEIIGVVYSFQDVSAYKQIEKQLLHKATHDVLTGLPNRALFLDRATQALAQARRFNLHVGVLHIDLDFFKEVNDRFGHNVGDLLLKYIATRMSEGVREIDTVARFGGHEFVVIFASQVREEDLIRLLNKFLTLFFKPFYIEEHEIIMTVSIGVSIYPRDGKDVDTLLKNADVALYQAKAMGRNRFQFYLEELNKPILQRAELRLALNQALQKNELTLNYQPLLELESGEIIGIEALLRWEHPTMGHISPQIFVPIAEESGLILSIGEWVLRTACKQTKIWQETSTYPTLKVSVNISVKQFQEKDFVALIRSILKESKLDPKYLELEITEGLILINVEQTVKKMQELKKIGVRFAIDDFGTGYSTLSYLKYFQFDTVKIDKSFIDNITTDVSNASIVEAVISMTRRMKINVLAEGVEHEEQVEFLRKHHMNQVQGYYFSRPLDLKTCTARLNQK